MGRPSVSNDRLERKCNTKQILGLPRSMLDRNEFTGMEIMFYYQSLMTIKHVLYIFLTLSIRKKKTKNTTILIYIATFMKKFFTAGTVG